MNTVLLPRDFNLNNCSSEDLLILSMYGDEELIVHINNELDRRAGFQPPWNPTQPLKYPIANNVN